MDIYFYSRKDLYGEFSNFAEFGIEMKGNWWPTVEHYYQSQKFNNEEYQEKIRECSMAKQAFDLGTSRLIPIKPNWEEIKDQIMYDGVFKKFTTHEELKKLLLETGKNIIIENSPYDYYWGCGKDGTGQNKLGKTLMKVRDLL